MNMQSYVIEKGQGNMKFYKPEELRAGMRLAKQIYNKQGVLLYERGLVLTDQIIASVQNFRLLGVMVLEPAEPLPPFSAEEQESEQLQTSYMFRLRDSLISISKGQPAEDLPPLVADIVRRFGSVNHPVTFSQTIRSSEDYNYKHAVCTAILSALIAHRLGLPSVAINDLVTAALLADFGYLYVPRETMSKPEDDLTNIDLLSIEQYRTKAMQLLKRDTNPFGLSENTFTTLTEFLRVPRKEDPQLATASFHFNTKILMVADKYDRMTAMSLNYQPVTPVQALNHLQKQDVLYDVSITDALSTALSILPVGQCVELSTHQQAMIVSQTPGDQFHPQVLDLATNAIYDLSSPKLRGVVEVKDLMTTMDQRYPFDEKSLRHFVPDTPLQATTRRIRLRLEKARKREAAKRARVTG